jgi:predicted DNA binding CopG/RHH family protein
MTSDDMRAEYDFSTSRANPYAKRLKKQITIRIDANSLDYFKEQAEEIGLPYQSLINLYLADCVSSQRKLTFA